MSVKTDSDTRELSDQKFKMDIINAVNNLTYSQLT